VDHDSMSTSGKKFGRPHLNRKKVGVVACTYHPSDRRKPKIRSHSRLAWQKVRPVSPK
jgi:hypothetical protein